MIKIIAITLLLLWSASTAFATPTCQVLDKAASKLDLTVDVFGNTRKSKIDQIKAFLWIDPSQPETASLSASLVPQLSKLFGNFEENPLMIGMLANMLDNEILFRSLSIQKGATNYEVTGKVISGEKTYPADFSVMAKEIGNSQSRFLAKVQSKNFQKVIGTPGYANGNFDMVFRTKSGISKEECRL